MKTLNLYSYLITIAIVVFSQNTFSQDSKSFSTCKELIGFAKETNVSFLNASLQKNLADLTTKSSYANIINPMVPTSAMAINNIEQQVSFLPGEVFGQPAGSYKQVTMGQQYSFTFNLQPQFDILNLGSIAQVQTARANAQLVDNQNKINELEIYNKINATYFNILSFNAQSEMITEQLTNAEKIHTIIENKFNIGIARKQELNEAEVNLITLSDKLEQLALNIQIQYQNLNLLLENEVNIELVENLWDYNENAIEPSIKPNNLLTENAILQKDLANKELRVLKFQHAPVVSFISSFNWQNLSNDNFFSSDADWINYGYIGLKIRYDIPTTTQKYANLKSKQIQLEMLKNSEEHIQKENDTYEKNFNQFEEGILSLDKLLISQNDLIISKLNMIAALANIGFNQTKIEINNEL